MSSNLVNESSRPSRLIKSRFVLEEHLKEEAHCIRPPVFMALVLEQTGVSKIHWEIFIDVLLIYRKLKDLPQGLSRPFRNSEEEVWEALPDMVKQAGVGGSKGLNQKQEEYLQEAVIVDILIKHSYEKKQSVHIWILPYASIFSWSRRPWQWFPVLIWACGMPLLVNGNKWAGFTVFLMLNLHTTQTATGGKVEFMGFALNFKWIQEQSKGGQERLTWGLTLL